MCVILFKFYSNLYKKKLFLRSYLIYLKLYGKVEVRIEIEVNVKFV